MINQQSGDVKFTPQTHIISNRAVMMTSGCDCTAEHLKHYSSFSSRHLLNTQYSISSQPQQHVTALLHKFLMSAPR